MIAQMNTDLAALGGACGQYRAYATAWADNARGVVKGKLSSWGKNITDVNYVDEHGTPFPIVRTDNWDEKLGVVAAAKVVLRDAKGERVTLQSVLERAGAHGKYMFPNGIDAKAQPGMKVAFRVQTQWVPLAEGQASRKIAPEHYSYQTKTAADPCNAIFLGTAQGLYAHADAPGKNRLLAHGNVDGADGAEITEHWLVAEPTAHDVGMAQHDDAPPDATKARAVEIGIEGMGPHANCAVCVSIPHTQTGAYGVAEACAEACAEEEVVYRSLSQAARVSVDEAVAGKKRARDVGIVRDASQPVVVTIMLYNTVQAAAGESIRVLPEDLALAVKGMERIYSLAERHGGAVCKLSELPAMLHKLEAKHLAHLAAPAEKADPFAPTAHALAAFA